MNIEYADYGFHIDYMIQLYIYILKKKNIWRDMNTSISYRNHVLIGMRLLGRLGASPGLHVVAKNLEVDKLLLK